MDRVVTLSKTANAFRKKRPGLELNVVTLAILLAFCYSIYKNQDDHKCKDNDFGDEDLYTAVAPIGLWFFVQLGLVVIIGILKTFNYDSMRESPDLNEGMAIVLLAMIWTVWNEFSITFMDNPLSSRAFSCKLCDGDGALEKIADTVASVTAGGAVMQLLRVVSVFFNLEYRLDSWKTLPDTDSRMVVLGISGLSTFWTCNLLLIWTDVHNFETVFGLTFACGFAAAGMLGLSVWVMSQVTQFAKQQTRFLRSVATKRESDEAFWKHLTACAVHVVSLIIALLYKAHDRKEPTDTNLKYAFRQYEVILDDIIFVDCVVIFCHSVRVVLWLLAASENLPSTITNPWRWDAGFRVLEYSATAGILLLQFNAWCAWQDEDSAKRNWSERTELMDPTWFWTILIVNCVLQIVGSLHEFNDSIAQLRLDNFNPRRTERTQSRVCNSYVLSNFIAYCAVFLLFYLVFFNTDVTPGSSRIVPMETCISKSDSCGFYHLGDAEAIVHIRSAWRFFAVMTMALYLAFGAVDAVVDPHMRVLLFTTLGCVTKIGVGWGVLLLKAMSVPFSDGLAVTSYPGGVFMSLIPGLVATVAMVSSSFFVK